MRATHHPSRSCVLLLALALSGIGSSAAQESERAQAPDARALRTQFDAERRDALQARLPAAEFLAGWLAKADDEQLELLAGVGQSWERFGQQPPLFLAFLMDSSFQNRLAEVLPALEVLFEQLPALESDAAWQGLRARARLAAGEIDAALYAARRSRELDARLCDDSCPPMLQLWLESGRLPGHKRWPTLAVPPVYRALQADCSGAGRVLEAGQNRLPWSIPEPELVAALLGKREHAAWLLRETWKLHLLGCDQGGAGSRLSQALDTVSAAEIQLSWRSLQDSIRHGVPASLWFLGVELPLPSLECDYSRDPSCLSAHRPLELQSAQELANVLRGFSRHLHGFLQCAVSDQVEGEEPYESLQRRFRAALKSSAELDPAESLAALRNLLGDAQWVRLWARWLPSEIEDRFHALGRSQQAPAALELARTWLASAPPTLRSSASAAQLEAFLLLRNREPQAALGLMQLAQWDTPRHSRMLRIAQLRAGLQGAELGAGHLPASLPRPWVLGSEVSDAAVREAQAAPQSRGLDGVLAGDLAFGLGGAAAEARYELQRLWLDWLFGSGSARNELRAALSAAHGEAGAKAVLLQALPSLRLEPEPMLSIDGVALPLPDASCARRDCDTARPVDAEWLALRLGELHR